MNPNSLGGGIGTGLGTGLGGGLGSGLGATNEQQSIEELLLIAKMRGGSIGAVADEITHPERSILSTIGQGFKNAFSGFIETISMGSYAMAGILDSDKTIGEAIKAREVPSDVLLGEKDPDASTLQKVGSFVVRLATDVLLDPLTYVTFGASGVGVFGVRAASKVTLESPELSQILKSVTKKEIDETTAIKEISEKFNIPVTETDTLESITSKAKAGTDKKASVTKVGEDWMKLNIIAQTKGMGDVSLWSKNEVADMAGKMGREQGLKGKELKAYIDNAKKAVSDFSLAKKDALMAGKVAQVEDDILKEMVARSIGIKATSGVFKKNAAQALGRLMAHKPALIETIIDKGGIKFMGASLISGARIGATLDLIPGISKVDTITQTTRQFISKLFNRDGDLKGGGISAEAVVEAERYAVLAEHQRNKTFKELPKAWKKLKVSPEESQYMVDILELGLRPVDPKLARVFDLVHGKKVDNILPHEKEVLAGIRMMQGVSNEALDAKIAAGYRVTKQENYVMHFTDNEIKNVSHGNSKLSLSVGSNKFAKFAKYRQVTDKKLTNELLGSPETLGLKATFKIEEEQLVKDNYLSLVEKIKSNEFEITQEINNLTERINDFVRGGMRGQLDELLSKLPEKDQITAKAFMETADKYLRPIDIEKVSAQRAKLKYEAGIKIKEEVADMSEEALLALVKRIRRGEINLPGDVNAIGDLLETTKPTFKVSKHKAGVEGEIKDIAEGLKARSLEMRKAFMEQNIDKNDLSKFLNEITQHFTENTTGMNRILDQFIGNKQKLGDLVHEIELAKLAYRQSINDLPALSKYYTDKDGRIFERVRATIKEAEEKGIKFDHDGLSIMLRTSLETIRAVNAKYMVDAFAKEAGRARSMAPDSWRTVAVGALKETDESLNFSELVTSKGGEELVFHPEVAKRIETFISASLKDEATSEIMKKFDSLQGIWKASATSVWLAFHGRNGISNVFQNYLDIGLEALNPANHVFSAQMIGNEHELSKLTQELATAGDAASAGIQNKIYKLQSKVLFTDANGISWSHGMLNQVMKDNGIAFNPNLTGYMDLSLTREEQLKQIKQQIYPAQDVVGMVKQNAQSANPLSQQFLGYKAGRKVGNIIEDQARIINFVTNLKKTGDVSIATMRTKQFLFDYSNLSEFEKTFMRRLLPFYTWTRKNLELQARTLLSAPGRIAAEVHVGKTLGDVFAGGEMTDEERALLPDYLKNQLASGFTFVESRDGDKLKFQTTAQLPIEAAFTQGQMNVLFGSMSPLLRYPIEQVTGYSFFKDKQINDITDARNYKSAPQALKNFIGYEEVPYQTADGTWTTKEVALRPNRMNLLNQLPITSKPFAILGKLQDIDTTEGEKAVYTFFGMGTAEQNLTILEKQQEAILRAKVIKVLKDAKVGREFHKFYLTPQQ